MADDATQMDDFELGRPAIVCRWRLAGRALPLENRHLRALSRRRLGDAAVSPQLVAWAKQHIEWTLADGAAGCPEGVLMVVVDEDGRAAMTVGPYEPLAERGVEALARRALSAAAESELTGVAPESLWAARGDWLVRGGRADLPLSGVDSLVSDLARTTGTPLASDPALARAALEDPSSLDEVFLVSDEHGIVPADGAAGPRARRLAEGYARLLERPCRR